MTKRHLGLDGLEIISPVVHEDDRGSFSEVWKTEVGFPEFLQMNMSISKLCTFRGLHYQWARPQGKLIRVTQGRAIFFEMDVRSYSPTFGKFETIPLDCSRNEWLWVPSGFANGFFTLENDTSITYVCTEHWSRNEGIINHRSLGYDFNILGSIRNISEKDENAPTFDESMGHLESISHFFKADRKNEVNIDTTIG